jgi:uncharacterized cupredoxin-like copper-binding protein
MKLLAGLVVLVVAASLTLAIGMAAQGAREAATSGSAAIVLEDLRFVPNRLDARVGIPLRVRLTNGGTERHDLNFPSLHMPGLAGVESILEPGETRSITLEFDEPGTHTFICTLPGHAASGMTGAVYVQPRGSASVTAPRRPAAQRGRPGRRTRGMIQAREPPGCAQVGCPLDHLLPSSVELELCDRLPTGRSGGGRRPGNSAEEARARW